MFAGLARTTLADILHKIIHDEPKSGEHKNNKETVLLYFCQMFSCSKKDLESYGKSELGEKLRELGVIRFVNGMAFDSLSKLICKYWLQTNANRVE